MSDVYVVRLTEEQRTIAIGRLGCLQTSRCDRIVELLQSARPEHPERQAARDKFIEVADSLDFSSDESLRIFIETREKLRTLDEK